MQKMIIGILAVFIGANLFAAESREDFFQAAGQGDTTKIEQMLSSGIDVNAKNILGESALIFSIESCQAKAAQLLISKGAKTAFYTKLGYSPLIMSAATGCNDILKLLLEQHVDIEAEMPQKKTCALFKAAERGHDDTVSLLLTAGANPDHATIYGVTPLIIASQNGHNKIVELLVAAGADVNAKSLINQTPLLSALDFGHPQIAAFLIEHGAAVSDLDKYNRSPLMFAASKGYADIVATLVEKGADVNMQNEKKQTAAVLAQTHKFDDIVTFLLKNGADSTGLVFPDTTKEKIVKSDLYDTPPQPIGGMAAVQKRLRYPRKARTAGLEGTITITATVDRRGRVGETKVLKSFGDTDCEKAAIRAIKNTRWKPARKGKKTVKAPVDVDVEFSLKK